MIKTAIYLKSLGVGAASSIAAMVLAVVVTVAATFVWIEIQMWELTRAAEAGQGGIGAVSVGFAENSVIVALIAGVVAFIIGFRWQFRRASRSAPR